mmetsp:Transcript_331/g.379  ORF Transcript_331/g.379 Transcript_331/m.379 type:complete len:469 (+) Transcript_331:469-1875(+)
MSKNPCVNVTLLERTQSFKRFGGPIQLASNALQILKEMDIQVYNKVMEKFTFTGDKRNGIKDGIRDEWYATFDLGSPAKARNMPYTGVIERPDLQDIYLRSLPEGVLRNGKSVQSYTSKPDGIHVTLEDRDTGIETITGDVLIGADGIWSNVRAAMRDEPAKGEGSGATYSGYTVFAGELNYDSFDNGEVGYKVYIGPGQYFVITDIGKGRYQWYAFLARPPDSADNVEKKEGSSLYLQNIFKGWSEDVHHILKATTEEEIQQRDLWDRPPSVAKPWTDGSVALLGDSIHAMMPNLGQGGCQAMEDAFVLAQEIEKCESRTEIPNSLEKYRNRRLIRSAVVQGLSRFASDIIIRGFDTPAKITKDEDGKIQFENFNYAGIVTKMLQPILPIFFSVQFNFLYEGWRNEAAIDFKATVGFVFIGGFILLLSGGAVGGAVGEVGLLGGLGLDSLLGGEGIEALLANLQDFF